MHGPNSSSRLGPLNNANLSQVLDKSWSSIFSTIIQDKPKKLPGNPIIVVCPTAPVVPKIINKWIKLLSNIGTVVTVTANFGQCLSSFNPKCKISLSSVEIRLLTLLITRSNFTFNLS